MFRTLRFSFIPVIFTVALGLTGTRIKLLTGTDFLTKKEYNYDHSIPQIWGLLSPKAMAKKPRLAISCA